MTRGGHSRVRSHRVLAARAVIRFPEDREDGHLALKFRDSSILLRELSVLLRELSIFLLELSIFLRELTVDILYISLTILSHLRFLVELIAELFYISLKLLSMSIPKRHFASVRGLSVPRVRRDLLRVFTA